MVLFSLVVLVVLIGIGINLYLTDRAVADWDVRFRKLQSQMYRIEPLEDDVEYLLERMNRWECTGRHEDIAQPVAGDE